jgi:hypothetical protein
MSEKHIERLEAAAAALGEVIQGHKPSKPHEGIRDVAECMARDMLGLHAAKLRQAVEEEKREIVKMREEFDAKLDRVCTLVEALVANVPLKKKRAPRRG